jgi:hypothetical protein
MQGRSAVVCAVVLALFACASAVPVKQRGFKHVVTKAAARAVGVKGDKTIACASVPIAFCTIDAGCKVFKDVCEEDTTAPPINCTTLMSSTGDAVEGSELALIAAISTVKSTTWTTMQGTQSALGKAADAMKEADKALKSYNESLIAYQKEADKLDVLSAELDELVKNCSIPSPPLTCPTAILEAKAAIAKQNATCELKWIQTTLQESKMAIANSASAAQDAIIKEAMSAPAKVFSDAAAQITAAETAKSAAIGFWTLVKNACISPAPMPSVQLQKTSKRHTRLHAKH